MPDYVFQLDEKTRKYAEKILNENDDSRTNCLKIIRQWADDNPSLHIRREDEYILPFLRGCKFNIDKTKSKLTNFYTMRRDRSEWFINRNPLLSEIQYMIRQGCFVPMLKTNERAEDNCVVVVVRPFAYDPKRYGLDDFLKTANMILDVAVMCEEKAQIYGVIAIIDMTGLSFAHARQLTPFKIRNIVYAWHNYHCRPKQLEFFNAPSYFNVILNVFKSFMSDKLKSRVRGHSGGIEDIHQVVDRTILPKDYGGDGETVEELAKYWNNKLYEYADWFADDEQFRALSS